MSEERRLERTSTLGWLPGPWGYVLNRAAAPLVPFGLARRIALPWGDFAYATWKRPREAALHNYARVLDRSIEDPLVERAARRCCTSRDGTRGRSSQGSRSKAKSTSRKQRRSARASFL